MERIIFSVLLCLFLSSVLLAGSEESKSFSQLEIKDGWRFRQSNDNNWYPATIPGCIHTDLIDNKLIEDPYFGLNEQKLQWIGEKDWTYQTTFDVQQEILKRKNIELVFKGLDTYAEVYLNKTKILSANNMFREWKVD
ncbi:MAG: hypothetical protein NTX65_02790 [Ignavibacteriales bacterium]|nr:hypothetical protein [Ignavibacteriales bacterium]